MVNSMHGQKTLLNLSNKQRARILEVHGGHGFRRKLGAMGIREGQIVTMLSKQPFRGPLTISVCGCQMTLGRGMAHRIFVEDIK